MNTLEVANEMAFRERTARQSLHLLKRQADGGSFRRHARTGTQNRNFLSVTLPGNQETGNNQ